MTESSGSPSVRCLSGLYGIDAAQVADVQRRTHVVVLAGETIPDREAFFAALAAGLHFPDYFGHNWDAVYDLLTDPGWFPNEGLVLVLNDFQRFAEQHPEQWRIGLQVFQEACAFWRPLGRSLHVLLSGMREIPSGARQLPPDCFANTRNGAERVTEPTEISSFAADAARIWVLNREDRWDEALAVARELVTRFPDNPRAHFEYAGVLDYQGREMEAVAPYRQALALGLSGDDLPLFYVQFGSTLRNAGELDESITLLREGSARFPDFVPIRAFLALALLSAGRGQEAVVLLLDIITSHAGQVDLAHYARSLRAYTDELRVGQTT